MKDLLYLFEESPYWFLEWLYQFAILSMGNKGSVYPYPPQCLLSIALLILNILTGVRRNLRAVLVCSSINIKDGTLFGKLSGHFHFFFDKSCVHIHSPLFSGLVCFPDSLFFHSLPSWGLPLTHLIFHSSTEHLFLWCLACQL